MKVYAVVASRVYSGEVLREPEGIYADEKRAVAVCAARTPPPLPHGQLDLPAHGCSLGGA